MLLSILLVVAILSLLVFVHELGHFLTARRAGVIVEEFGFGIPPRLWGVKRKGTIYSINALPIGGFVRLKGENSADRGPGTFASARFISKVKILLAGVAMNALVGYLLLLFLALTGLPPVPSFEVRQAGFKFAREPSVMLLEVGQGSAAERAGLKKGDIILSGNGQSFNRPDELRQFTLNNAGKPVEFEIERNGAIETKPVKLDEGTKEGGQLGTLPFESYLVKYSPLNAAAVAAKIFWEVAKATVGGFIQLLASLPRLVGSVFSPAPAETGAVGPVGITAILSNILFLGFRYVALVVVSITVSLAVINAFPLPALDGGRLMLLALAKVAGRDVSRKVEQSLHGAGFVALILLIVLITYTDVRRFF